MVGGREGCHPPAWPDYKNMGFIAFRILPLSFAKCLVAIDGVVEVKVLDLQKQKLNFMFLTYVDFLRFAWRFKSPVLASVWFRAEIGCLFPGFPCFLLFLV